jgi:hypothetical protein
MTGPSFWLYARIQGFAWRFGWKLLFKLKQQQAPDDRAVILALCQNPRVCLAFWLEASVQAQAAASSR